jgi:multisubunit Na+/H+ antiporter MnhB subunit
LEQREDLAVALISVVLLIVVVATFSSELLDFQLATIPSRPPLEEYLWTYRGLDVLVQAFIVFAAATAIATLFRTERGPGAMETTCIESGEDKQEAT